ncbi:MAG: hypothetical protein NZ704_15270, partial [Geminicoccaceae bacterium]|nr:hypothetical protein [Geminicoccaceae bacterium]
MLSGSRGAKATAPDTSPSGPEPNAPASAENGAFRGTVPLGPDGKPLPEWIDVPEQFVRDTGIDWKGLVDSYKHLRARLSKREDELKAKLLEELRAEREKALSGELEEVYPLRASEGVLPEGVELVGDDERDTAFVAEMRAWAKSVGLMPDQWRELVDKFAKWRLSRLPDP